MPAVVNGIPEPRIVLFNGASQVDDFTLTCFDGGRDAPPYFQAEPDLLEHELDPDETHGEIDTELLGFRFRVTLHFSLITGDEIKKLTKLLDRRAYTKAVLYPWKTDQPYFFEEVSLSAETIKLAWLALIAHVDFELTIRSTRLLDYFPLTDATFLAWGNLTLRFSDLTMAYSTLT